MTFKTYLGIVIIPKLQVWVIIQHIRCYCNKNKRTETGEMVQCLEVLTSLEDDIC